MVSAGINKLNFARARVIFAVTIVALAASLSPAQETSFDYLGCQPPGNKAQLFAPGLISTQYHDDYAPLFSRDGKEVYFRIIGYSSKKIRSVIFVMRKGNTGWSQPEIASFSGEYIDFAPVLSRDGKRLFFSSDRPLSSNDKTKDLNIWYVTREGGKWSDPRALSADVNSDQDEFLTSIEGDGNLYMYREGKGPAAIFRIGKSVDGSYAEVEKIPEVINSPGGSFAPTIAPDGSFLIFGRRTGVHVSFWKDDQWSVPKKIAELSSVIFPKFTNLSPDGKYLFFVGHGTPATYREKLKRNWSCGVFDGPPRWGRGDIYWISIEVIEKLRP